MSTNTDDEIKLNYGFSNKPRDTEFGCSTSELRFYFRDEIAAKDAESLLMLTYYNPIDVRVLADTDIFTGSKTYYVAYNFMGFGTDSQGGTENTEELYCIYPTLMRNRLIPERIKIVGWDESCKVV